MRPRLMIAGLLAGVVLFFWGFVSHAVLPLAGTGMQDLPGEAQLAPAIAAGVRESGLYAWPGGTQEEQQAKAAQGPSGLLIFKAEPTVGMGPQLIKQLLADLALGLLFAILLWCALDRLPVFWCRMGFVTMLGAISWLSVHAPYRIWYGFPESYTLAQLADCCIGAALAGCVLGAMVKK